MLVCQGKNKRAGCAFATRDVGFVRRMKPSESDEVTPVPPSELVREDAQAPWIDRSMIDSADTEVGAMPEALEELAGKMGVARRASSAPEI